MTLRLSNFATGTLAAPINTTATTIAIQVGEDINFPVCDQPGDWFPIVIVDSSANREIMRCTNRAGTDMTVVRAQESTIAYSFSAGARVDVRLTAGAISDFMQKSAGNSMAGRLDMTGANDTGRIKFSGLQAELATGKPLGLEFGQADLFFGVKPANVETVGLLSRWVWNDRADGMGTDVANLTDVGALTIAGAFTAGSSITAASTVNAKGATGNVHFWLKGPADEDRMVLYSPAASAGNTILRVTGTQSFTFNTSGQFKAPGALFADDAYLNTNGNITGSVWLNWGKNDAYNAIHDRIESRAAAYTNNCVNATQMAGLVDVDHTGNGPLYEYAGYVVTGTRKIENSPARYLFRFRQPQRHIPNLGWAAAFPY